MIIDELSLRLDKASIQSDWKHTFFGRGYGMRFNLKESHHENTFVSITCVQILKLNYINVGSDF